MLIKTHLLYLALIDMVLLFAVYTALIRYLRQKPAPGKNLFLLLAVVLAYCFVWAAAYKFQALFLWLVFFTAFILAIIYLLKNKGRMVAAYFLAGAFSFFLLVFIH